MRTLIQITTNYYNLKEEEKELFQTVKMVGLETTISLTKQSSTTIVPRNTKPRNALML